MLHSTVISGLYSKLETVDLAKQSYACSTNYSIMTIKWACPGLKGNKDS